MSLRKVLGMLTGKKSKQPGTDEEKATLIAIAETYREPIAVPNKNLPPRPRELIKGSRELIVENLKLIKVLEEKGKLEGIKKYAKEKIKKQPDNLILQPLLAGMDLSILKVFNDALTCFEKLEKYFSSTPTDIIENWAVKDSYDSLKESYQDVIVKKLQEYQNEKKYLRQILGIKNEPDQASVQSDKEEVVVAASSVLRLG